MKNIKLTTSSYYGKKDQLKSNRSNKYIGRGSERSSTQRYALDYGSLANSGTYNSNDAVFISAEGNRLNRLDPDFNEIDLAIKAQATFITDIPSDRQRQYNIGERQVASHLISNGYTEHPQGTWNPAKRGHVGADT